MTIHKFDNTRLKQKTEPMPDCEAGEPCTDRIEQGFNIYWVDENPALFGITMQRMLMRCPPDKWNVRIVPGIYPGETWSIVATRKADAVDNIPKPDGIGGTDA